MDAVLLEPSSSRSSARPFTTVSDTAVSVRVTPEMLRHSRIQHSLFFGAELYGLFVLVLLLWSGFSSRIRRWVGGVRRPFLVGLLYFVIYSIVSSALWLPLSYYAGYVVPHQFHLSHQTFAAWFFRWLKAVAVMTVIGAIIAPLALLLVRKVRRWWFPLWLASIPFIIISVFAAPLVIDPLFNDFVPLRNGSLRGALLEQASRAGIEGGRVFEVDRSKQASTMNAYVTGIGPSKRIVLWDTLLVKMTREEILAVMGHEMGHYVLRHVWKSIVFGVLLSLVGFFLLQKLVELGLSFWGARWGIEGASDPAVIPWVLFLTSVGFFLVMPLTAAYSRHLEHQADVFGLELTHQNRAMATAFVKFAEDSKVDPAPPRWIELWCYSHPSLRARIDFALHYKPWERGEPNAVWRAGRSAEPH